MEADLAKVAEVMTAFLYDQLDERLKYSMPEQLRESMSKEHLLVLDNLRKHGYVVCTAITEETS